VNAVMRGRGPVATLTCTVRVVVPLSFVADSVNVVSAVIAIDVAVPFASLDCAT
jgi:hypothetical protein